MGPALALRSNQIVAGYASVAGSHDVQKMHQEKGLFTVGANVDQCPHASAARAAARMAEDLAAAAKEKQKKLDAAKQAKHTTSIPTGCPFHRQAVAAESSTAAATQPVHTSGPASFSYDQFFVKELDEKHQDQSYRYFNNINRLATKFPVAHTSNVNEEVEVWCANDYLGMGNNPVVLETIQCGSTLKFVRYVVTYTLNFPV
jgi:5-aminolevulinate synthase